MATLRITSGPPAEGCVELAPGDVLEIGRRPPEPAGVPGLRALVLDDPKASRAHARIARVGDRWMLSDLGSSNGTLVNGRQVVERVLEDGDRIRVGDTVLEWRSSVSVSGKAMASSPSGGRRSVSASGEGPASADDASTPTPTPTSGRPSTGRRKASRPRARLAAGAIVVAVVAAMAFIAAIGDPFAPRMAPSAPGRPASDLEPVDPTRPDTSELSESAPAETAPARTTPLTATRGSTIADTATPDLATPDLATEVEPLLASGQFKDAARFLEGIGKERPEADVAVVAALRARVLDAAAAEVAKVRTRVERLASAGEIDDARDAVLDLLVRLPEERAEAAADILDVVRAAEARRLEDARDAEEEPERAAAAEIDALLARGRRLLGLEIPGTGPSGTRPQSSDGGPGVGPGEGSVEVLATICAEIESLALRHARQPAYARRRKEVEEVFLGAKRRILEAEARAGAFHATRVEWKGDAGDDGDAGDAGDAGDDGDAGDAGDAGDDGDARDAGDAGDAGDAVVLAYDFAAPGELADFHLLPGDSSELRIEKGALVLRGECRMLHGVPFRGRLAIRWTLPAGGYDPAAPDLSVALFTRELDRLTSPTGRARSLLRPPTVGSGGPPADFIVFGLGYRTAVAEYAGRVFEEIPVDGREDPVTLPANVILGGRRGDLLHSDPREAAWARSLDAPLRGALKLEVGLAAGEVTWTLNGRAVVAGGDPGGGGQGAGVEGSGAGQAGHPFRRFRQSSVPEGPEGTVTLFTHGPVVRIQALEVRGTVRREWLFAGVERALAAAAKGLRAAGR